MKCKCGCGESFTPSPATLWRISKGHNAGFIPGHAHRGKRNGNWKGGRFVAANGYVYVLRPEHPNSLAKGYVGYVAEHRLVMSEHLGRPIAAGEVVHHVDGVRSNNALANLVLISRCDHTSSHSIGSHNGNWRGGRVSKACPTCGEPFLPTDKRNDSDAKYCGRQCFYDRNKHRYPATAAS